MTTVKGAPDGGGHNMKHIFIINPEAGKLDSSVRLRSEIEAVCPKYGIEPLICISEYKGYERETAEKMSVLFSNEEIRFYAVGGSGTFANVVSGIKNFALTEVACYPCGYSNDFLKCYTMDYSPFRSIENLINGRVDTVDVIESDVSAAPNFVLMGIGAKPLADNIIYNLLSLVNPNSMYVLNTITDVLTKKNYDYVIDIDGKDYSGKYTMVVCFNGICMGSCFIPSDKPRINDGYMNVMLIDEMSLFGRLGVFNYFKNARLDMLGNKGRLIRAKKVTMYAADKSPLQMNIDGEMYASASIPSTMRLMPARMKLVVPQEVHLPSVD